MPGLTTIDAGTIYRYRISGLNLDSDMELPSAILDSEQLQATQVSIRAGSFAPNLDKPLRESPEFQMAQGEFLLRIPGATFLIQHGTTIRYMMEPGHDPGDVALYLLGSCLAILLQQRGDIILHASAVAVNGQAMLFCGPSGQGKSTLAAMLCSRGYRLLCDDTCNLISMPDGRFGVRADGRMLKLWKKSVDHLGLEAEQGPAVRAQTDKFYVEPKSFDAGIRPVGGVYLLQFSDSPQLPSITPLDPLEAVVQLAAYAFRPGVVEAMGLEREYFQASAHLQQQAGIFSLKRSQDLTLAVETLKILENQWSWHRIRQSMNCVYSTSPCVSNLVDDRTDQNSSRPAMAQRLGWE
jgi:hypothetical protein